MNPLVALLVLASIRPVQVGVPNRQPQLAAGNGVVTLVFGSGHFVMFARSDNNGQTFSKPVAIAAPAVLALGRHRGPRIVFSGKAMIISAVGGASLATGEHAHGLPADGNLMVWRSIDDGRTWSNAVIVNDVSGSAREGLHAMAADSTGHVAAAWLDLRDRGTRLYGAFSDDGGLTWSKNLLLYESSDGTICQCCHPSLAALGGGEFAVMFRNALGGMRDMYLMRARNGRVTAAPSKLGTGSWEINACPMDGGGLAVSGDRVLTVWRRGKDLWMVEPGKRESRVATGKDVALVTQSDRVFAIWTSGGRIESSASGRTETLSNDGAFPSVTRLPDGGVLAAWEEKGEIALKRLQ
jgi:hypothetical protein